MDEGPTPLHDNLRLPPFTYDDTLSKEGLILGDSVGGGCRTSTCEFEGDTAQPITRPEASMVTHKVGLLLTFPVPLFCPSLPPNSFP